MIQADTTTPPTQTANDSAAAAAALAAEEQLRASGRQIKRVTKDLPEYQPQHKSKPKGRLSESLQVNYGGNIFLQKTRSYILVSIISVSNRP